MNQRGSRTVSHLSEFVSTFSLYIFGMHSFSLFFRKPLSEPMRSHIITFDNRFRWEFLPTIFFFNGLSQLAVSKGSNKHDNFQILIFILNLISGYNLDEHVQDVDLMDSIPIRIKIFRLISSDVNFNLAAETWFWSIFSIGQFGSFQHSIWDNRLFWQV